MGEAGIRTDTVSLQNPFAQILYHNVTVPVSSQLGQRVYSHYLSWEKEDRWQPCPTLEILMQLVEESTWTDILLTKSPGNPSLQPGLGTTSPHQSMPNSIGWFVKPASKHPHPESMS